MSNIDAGTKYSIDKIKIVGFVAKKVDVDDRLSTRIISIFFIGTVSSAECGKNTSCLQQLKTILVFSAEINSNFDMQTCGHNEDEFFLRLRHLKGTAMDTIESEHLTADDIIWPFQVGYYSGNATDEYYREIILDPSIKYIKMKDAKWKIIRLTNVSCT